MSRAYACLSARTAVVVVVLVLLGGCADNVPLSRTNRPPVTPNPIAGRCWPLPTDERFEFSYQVRGDETVRTGPGARVRRLVVQYNQTDAEAVLADVDGILTDAGFVADPADPTGGTFTLDGYGSLTRTATDLEDVPSDNIVRGHLVLEVPETRKGGDRCRT